MNRRLIATSIAITLFGSHVLAQTEPAHEHNDPVVAESDSHEHSDDASLQQGMHDRMVKMQASMQAIHAADDPEVRMRLMHEHMREMHAMMQMMDGMHRNGMMPGCTMGERDTAQKEMESHEHE